MYTFKILQNLFTELTFLAYCDSGQHLYIDVNVFKQYKFKAVIYHVDENSDDITEFLCSKIQFILFLSKLFTSAE